MHWIGMNAAIVAIGNEIHVILVGDRGGPCHLLGTRVYPVTEDLGRRDCHSQHARYCRSHRYGAQQHDTRVSCVIRAKLDAHPVWR